MACVGGIAFSAVKPEVGLSSPQVAAFGVVGLVFILLKPQTRLWLVVVAIVAGLILGLWRGETRQLETAGYQAFEGQKVQLSGVVADDVTAKGGAMGLKLRDVRINNVRLGGEVWASTSTALSIKRADHVDLNGTLRPGFGIYAASMSFAKLAGAKRAPHDDPSREARDAFDRGVERTIPQPEAALAIGYLTGQHNLLPDDLTKQMQRTGLIHLVIAGGYNVTILVRLLRRVGARFAKKLALIGAGGVLCGLVVVSGFVAPMARTAVVTGLSLVCWYYGRWPHPLVLLPVAAAITAFLEPSFVWGDVGWYMTFIAYGGLIVLGPMLKRWWWGDRHHGEVKQIIVDTVAVQIVATPLMAFAFQQYSIYGLPANLLVLPLMSLTMLAGIVAGLSGMLLPAAAAHWFSWPANVLLSYTHKVIVWMAGAPDADLGSGLSVAGLVLSYFIVAIFIWRLKRKTGYDFRAENPIE